MADELAQAMHLINRFMRRHQVNGDYVRVTIELDSDDNKFRAIAGSQMEKAALQSPYIRTSAYFEQHQNRSRMFGVDLKFTSTEERTQW